MNPRGLQRIALASLIALILSSLALALIPANGMPAGAALAVMKAAALGFVGVRIRRADVYAMQWSSMFILLFVAEGVVRAMSDPQPSAALGGLEAVVAAVYYFAVLAYLRPLKKAARESRR